MSHPISLQLHQKPSQNIKQLQRLIMSRQMQQAIHLLQVPVMELSPLIEAELEQNPLLEYSKDAQDENQEKEAELEQLEEDSFEESCDLDEIPEKALAFDDRNLEILQRLDEDFRDHFSESGNTPVKSRSELEKMQTFLESSIESQETLFEHLMRQAKEAFDNDKQLSIAEIVIGSIDKAGFFTNEFEEIALLAQCTEEEVGEVLRIVQSFDPIGIGARNLKESLLLQLTHHGKKDSPAFTIIAKHFDDLLHNRIPLIRKELQCSMEEIGKAIDRDIAGLDLHPGTQLNRDVVSVIVPDATLKEEHDGWVVIVNDDSMPKLRLNTRYMRMLNDESLSKEEKEFIKQKILSAKWLMRNLMQRNDTIERICKSLIKWHGDFFKSPEGSLVPLTMKTVADEIEVHESTVARAVSGKYIETPRGVLPLRSFFTNSLTTDQGGDVSARTAKDIISELILKEDKREPLSDEAISEILKAKGINCARRTVAKYRTGLKLGTARQRRKF